MDGIDPFEEGGGGPVAAAQEALMQATAGRLRLAMRFMELSSADEFGLLVGASGTAVRNWTGGARHLPPVWHMVVLCARSDFTLDWIYRGDTTGLSPSTHRRLLEMALRSGGADETVA